MPKWFTELLAVLAQRAVPLLAAALLSALVAAGWLGAERGALAQCVLVDPQPRTCASRS